MQITDWMTPKPDTVYPHTPLASCARRMISHGYRHLPVVDHDNVLVGLLTDFAVNQAGEMVGVAWTPHTEIDAHATAGDRMVPTDVVPHDDWPLAPVLTAMMRSWQDVAVVVDAERHPVGILSEHDVTRFATGMLPDGFLALRRGRAIVSLPGHADAQAAYDQMVVHQVRHVLVVDDGLPTGVVSFRDLVGGRVTRGRDVTVGELVQGKTVHTVVEGTPVTEAAALMSYRKLGCMPIVDFAGQAVSVITRSDLVVLCLAVLEGAELPQTWDAGHIFKE